MPELSTITDPYLPEPKGASSAAAGEVYISDGAGSGAWTMWPTGWGYYQDASAAQVISTTEAKLVIDGAGPLTNTNQLPREIRATGDLWNTTTNKITPVSVGDSYDVRLDLPVTAESTSPTELTISVDIGGTTSSSIVILEDYRKLGRPVPYTVVVNLILTALTSTTVSNGIQFFLTTDTGTATITNPSITIVRTHSGDF